MPMIIAIIQNGEYPYSHLISLTFPMDEEAMMTKLNEIGISDSNIASCHVVKISGRVPVLCVLENQRIDADEMNYLTAMNLPSFRELLSEIISAQ